MRAHYDFTTQPASFDFWTWVTAVKTRGATSVVFDTNLPFKYQEPQEAQRAMFDNVVIPICDLFGMPWEEGKPQREDIMASHMGGAYRDTKLNLIEFPLTEGPPTVTLRNSFKHQERNSNRETWLEFARQIGARVIEDAYDAPLSIAERFGIYAASSVNYHIAGGPGHACMMSNIPCVMFAPPSSIKLSLSLARPWKQYPQSTDRQRLVWEEVSLEALLAQHERVAV